MHARVTKERERELEKNSADDLIPDYPRGPHHFGNNGLSEGTGVVGLYGTNKLDCVNEFHHGFMLTGVTLRA